MPGLYQDFWFEEDLRKEQERAVFSPGCHQEGHCAFQQPILESSEIHKSWFKKRRGRNIAIREATVPFNRPSSNPGSYIT
jgi:hypothetical protein